jgi:uncharacterized protein (DUF934 family)
MKLIQNRRAAADSWQLFKPVPVEGKAESTFPTIPSDGDVIVPLAQWQQQKDALLARKGRTGVWLDSHEGADLIAADAPKLPIIALNFPKFGDGRSLSTARLLRERHGYKGELRAIGDVYRDLVLGMHRCGIDSFALRDDQDIDDTIKALEELPIAYQASVDQPLPLFRRRAS